MVTKLELEKITEKQIVDAVDSGSHFFITQLCENENGEMVVSLRRATIDSIAEVIHAAIGPDLLGVDGIGLHSEVFNDYERNIAGVMGYYWSEVDFSGDNPVIVFSTEQGMSCPEFEIHYEVGDLISIVNGNHWTDCSTILAIDKNRVTVDSLPFSKIVVQETLTHDDFSVFVKDKPLVGVIKLGQFAHSEGENTKALERSSHTEGRDTITVGQYGHAQGRDTIADYCCFSGGNRVRVYKGKTSFGFGTWLEIYANGAYGFGSNSIITEEAPGSFIAGLYLKAASPRQTIFGKFNEIDYDALYAFILGNGTSSKRSNAFTVDWSGNGWFSGGIKIGGKNAEDEAAEDVATEAYIKEEAVLKNVFATFTLETLVEGITANLSLKLLYDLPIDSFDIETDGRLLGLNASIGEKVRVATELMKSSKTRVVFYNNGEEVMKTSVKSTIKNCGMLYAEEE